MDILNVPNESSSPLITYGIFGDNSLLTDSLEKLNNTLHTDLIPDSLPNITPTQYLNQEILTITQTELQKFSTSSDFSANIELAFGYSCNVELAHTIIDNLAHGQLIPDIQIIPQSQLKADGAFGNNTIYLSQDLFNPQHYNSQQAVNVLLEEIGHYIDNQINIIDAPGDEGAIFAHLVQNQQLTTTELTALKAENDHGILNINGENIAVEHADTPGIFIVDNNGKISIDFLADSGSYHNEMAIFSLENMDNLTPGSVDYIKEAARRALSNSTLGYTVIIDINEGAKFVGELGESNRNDGNYSGLKAFTFTPGDKIAFMLVPQGTVQQVFDNPNAGNNQRPLFSIAGANPNNATQIGQLLPGTFGWEDIRVDQGTDADYNDIIFKIQGATGILTDIGGLFAPGKDWRNVPLAKELITFASQDNNINLTAKLSQDTGISNLDGITNNSEISGSVNNADNISKLQAKFSDGSNFVDILSELKANGGFVLNKEKLAQIKGGQIADGNYQLNLRAEDKFGNISEFLVKFTLDTTKPGIPTEVGLKNDGDRVTNQNTPTIKGNAENGALIELFDGQNKLGQTTVVNGFWEITTSQITDGLKKLTITATDISGNQSDASNTEFTIDSALPQINITNPQTNAILNPGARLQGTVNGTGSTIDKLSYRFGNGSEINVPVNGQGAFDVELTLTDLSGQQNLIIKAVDLAGNSKETTQNVVVNQSTPDTTAPLITASLNNDTGINTDGITFDSTITGTVTDISEITTFQAKLNSGNFVDVSSKLQNGNFTLDTATVTQINGGQLPDGTYQLTLKAEDKFGNVSSEVKLGFTLDTTKPAAATELKIKDDTDAVTKDNTPIISGQAETGTKVQIFDGQTKLGETTSENGVWEITTSQLTDGVKNLTVIITDIAGNVSDNASLSITVDTVVPDFNITNPQTNAILNPGARLQGTVNGTGSTIDKLSYRFGNGSEINVPVNGQGAFDVELTLTDLSGQQNLIIKAVDLAGNSKETTQNVVVNQSTPDTTAPLITASLNNDTGINTDGITFDSTITGTVTDISEITTFQAKLNSGNFVDVSSKLQNGNFTLDTATVTQINGGQLPDGTYQLTLKAEDKFGNVSSEAKLDFTLDTTAPQTPGFMLDSLFDSAPIGDSQTTFTNVKLIGQTETNATVTLQQTGTSITADAAGKFTFTDVPLILGDNSLTVNAKDAAGNTSTFTTIIKRVDQDNSDVVLDWNATLLNAVYEDKTAPPIASRNMAIAQTAVFDAINSITKTYKNYHFTGTAPTIVSAEAAAASAAYTVLVNLYPNQKTFFDTALTASLAKITDGEAETTGVTFGQTVANDILTLRSTDGFNTTVNYTPGTNPGDWQPTPPANASALLPQWGQVTPFGLTSGSQFRPAGEPVLTSDQYTTDFNQVKDLGSINSTTRTADQTEVAKFWADGSGTFTPPGHWNQIAQNAAATKGNSLVDNARLFALLDISLADAGIAAWDAKYTENSWRPITAIQKADTDGNPNTTADTNWKPLITTPPFPSYISGHSTFSAAAATVLTTILGDNVSFSLNSLGTPGVNRTFTNFNAAANEAGISRIYGGIHFNADNVDGLATGKSVGNYVLQNLLAPKLTVTPGEQLKLESQDIFGKNANFTLESNQTLPTGNLDSNGTLIFKPTPTQIGNYDFTLVARDGQQVTTKKFNLAVVADTLTTTRISGVIQNTAQKALSGVVVKIGDVSATTSADGSFTLTLAGVPSADAALIIQPGQQVDNIVYPSIAEKLPLLLGHDVYANVKNVIDRPIFLPPIDISNAQTINPAITQTVTSAAIPGSSVRVAANTLFDQENKPYTGKLSITTVPTELTPAALPDNLRPDLVVTIQPGEMNFRTPAPLSLPNIAGYAAGTQMDLWSINPQTGNFDSVGVGQVSADGKVINTISGGIRNSSWHFFAPPAPTPNNPNADPRNPEQGCDGSTATGQSNSDVELYSGAEIETHDLVPYQSLGVSRGLTLRYDSQRADARPIVHFGYSNVPSDPNLRLMAELTIKRGDFTLAVPGFAGGQYGLNGGENFWSIPSGGGKIDAALQADLRTLSSGRYDYDLTTGLLRFNNNQFNGSTSASTGKLLVVNSVNSAFGSGWGLAGLQELVTNPDGSVMLIDGDGSELLFEKNADNTYKSPAGHFSTLERLADGTFRHTAKDKTVYSFDAQNKLVKVSDRLNNETRYVYQNGVLSKIVDPVGLETTFTYVGNRITAITDPAGRVTKLTYDSNGNLLKITDPDGTGQTWEYDASHHMTAGIDQLGNRGQTFYNFAGRVTNSILKDGSTVKFDPVEVQGLYEPNKTNDPLNAPVAFQLGAATSTYTDANGNKIVNTLDRAGQIVSSADSVGLLPSVKRNQDNLVTQQTDARGNATSFTYDAKGNVLTIQDSLSFSTKNAGGNVLIVNGASSASTDNLTNLLQEAGFKTTVASSLPTDITGFSEIWDTRYDAEISNPEVTQYLSFLNVGGDLFLIGENNSFPTRNNSIIDFINQAGGGQLNFVALPFSDNVSQTVLAPYDNPNTIADGNVGYNAPGGFSGSGNGKFITIDTSNNGTAVAFDQGDLKNAPQGELKVILDINFTEALYDQPDSQNLLRNLIQSNATPRKFTYDSKFNQLTSKTDELGHQTLYQIDPNNGNLLSLTQVVGAVGGDDDLVTKFTYTDKGLVDLITDPLGRITDEDYDAKISLVLWRLLMTIEIVYCL